MCKLNKEIFKNVFYIFLVMILSFVLIGCGEKDDEKTPTPDEPVEPTPDLQYNCEYVNELLENIDFKGYEYVRKIEKDEFLLLEEKITCTTDEGVIKLVIKTKKFASIESENVYIETEEEKILDSKENLITLSLTEDMFKSYIADDKGLKGTVIDEKAAEIFNNEKIKDMIIELKYDSASGINYISINYTDAESKFNVSITNTLVK